MSSDHASLGSDFWNQSALAVAPALVGAWLVWRGQRYRVLETEAYSGLEDRASHGRVRTARSEPLYGAAGRVWIYRSRGLHWMLNVTAEPEGAPGGVLIRALEAPPGSGLRLGGPGLLTRALGIDPACQGLDVTRPDSPLRVEAGPAVALAQGPRVGMGKTPEPWASAPRRWWAQGHAGVSTWKR